MKEDVARSQQGWEGTMEAERNPWARSRDEDWADTAAGRVVPNEEQFNRKKEARCESRLAAGIIWRV